MPNMTKYEQLLVNKSFFKILKDKSQHLSCIHTLFKKKLSIKHLEEKEKEIGDIFLTNET